MTNTALQAMTSSSGKNVRVYAYTVFPVTGVGSVSCCTTETTLITFTGTRIIRSGGTRHVVIHGLLTMDRGKRGVPWDFGKRLTPPMCIGHQRQSLRGDLSQNVQQYVTYFALGHICAHMSLRPLGG